LSGLVILTPPLVLLIFLLVSFGFSGLAGLVSVKGTDSPGRQKPWHAVKNYTVNRAQPDYNQVSLLHSFLPLCML